MVKVGDKCLVLSDSWELLHHFKVVGAEKTKIELRRFDDYFGKGDIRTVTGIEMKEVVLSPASPDSRQQQPALHQVAQHIINLSSSLIRSKPRYPLIELLAKLAENPRLEKIPSKFIEACMRGAVASNFFTVWRDGRRKTTTYCLNLSPEMVEYEKNRAFAGSFASELSELSERIRLLIRHTSTVGTYRENLLQTLLRKNVPERYHVATGFIYGCSRQLDILIYDRIEYAPLFREGDLVVVPKAAVRAVIEVKTDLNKAELESSLQLLDEVAAFDDGRPPFFRGIFGFESSIDAEAIYAVVNLYHATGYSSRALHVRAKSTQGTRNKKFVEIRKEEILPYHSRMTELLVMYAGPAIPLPKALPLSKAASELLVWFDGEKEKELGEGGRFFHMRGAASKITENCARIAAILHTMEKMDGPITVDVLRNAIKLAAWFLNQYRLRFCPRSQLELDMVDLEEFITDKVAPRFAKERSVPGPYLCRYAPRHLRPVDRLWGVVKALESRGKVRVFGQKGGSWHVHLVDWFPPPPVPTPTPAVSETRTRHIEDRWNRPRYTPKPIEPLEPLVPLGGYELWPGVYLK
jgi:hypothetical protein